MHDLTLPFFVDRMARTDPDAPFLQEVDGPCLSYAEAQAQSLRWAAACRRLGVGAGARVATMLPAGIDGVCLWLGLASLGAVDVGISPDQRHRPLSDLLADCGARLLFTRRALLPAILGALTGAEPLATIVLLDGVPPDSAATAAPGPAILSASDLLREVRAAALRLPQHHEIAALIYTSGTTGRPKGVLVPWAQLHANCLGSIELYRPGDRYYAPFPMSHASGRLPVLFMAMVGGCVVLRERFSASAFWADIRRHRCTTTSMPGTIAAVLIRAPVAAEEVGNPLRFVSMIPLIPELDAFRARFGVEVRTMFNQTELSSPIASRGTELVDGRSCGRARPGYDLRIADAHDEAVADGESGELLVRADRPWTLFAGYLNQPEATAAAWRNGWFHTGDLFRRDAAGNYYLLGRLKDMIRRRGENISAAELERIADDHPGVAESAAVAVPSELGEDEIKLVLVPKPGAVLDPAEVRRHIAGQAPQFMVPRYVEIVAALPRTQAMQRVQKGLLREQGITAGTWDALAARPRSG